jgi:hypothetical protein
MPQGCGVFSPLEPNEAYDLANIHQGHIMGFIHTDVGPRHAGDVVEVTLTAVANVRLMDANNFNSYKNGAKHIYTGGVARDSPLRLTVPSFGHWHVAIDINGLPGSSGLKAGVRVVSK